MPMVIYVYHEYLFYFKDFDILTPDVIITVDTLLFTPEGRQFSSVDYGGPHLGVADIFPNANNGLNGRKLLVGSNTVSNMQTRGQCHTDT